MPQAPAAVDDSGGDAEDDEPGDQPPSDRFFLRSDESHVPLVLNDNLGVVHHALVAQDVEELVGILGLLADEEELEASAGDIRELDSLDPFGNLSQLRRAKKKDPVWPIN